MASILALASAVLFGAADFIGGMATRRAHVFAIVVVTGLAGLALLALVIPLMPASAPSRGDFAWGAAAGLAGGAAIALLYKALAIGTMSVLAPTTAVCGVSIPVLMDIALGQRPSMLTSIGMLLAVVAIVLVGQERRAPGAPKSEARGFGLALLSGVAIGVFYLTLARTSADAGLWPLVSARIVSAALFGAAIAAGGYTLRMEAPLARLVIGGGVLDMGANVFYLLSTRGGQLSVVVVLASLYPASTVLLARVILKERLSALQIAGVVCALAAVPMIVGGT